ncbi:UDP-N-acetylmuramate--L-alanyl-gamma-D-glutamyl-meso-2,6-diaminoheptandioate ligase [Thalassocella blandensis]|nr:UDP-N-acetylmuramate--L-alanyl-gamma-D-glutamyl-meso-2,6-diaminoheptandioate ligase [Thalassocella blandensis]
MHIHILGVCGTFMGSLALLAKAAGHRVTGCDMNVYPPMSTQLEAAGIELIQGFSAEQTGLNPDVFVIGNVVSRGNELMEEILDRGLLYVSGPQWLSENILQDKWVLAVAGTHGKTTTTSMLAWILEQADMQPGFLIGGVPGNFTESARLGGSDFFVIEADEYDTAFFDKRSKFVHYHPRTLLLNNLEYDHADIFPDLAAIQKQFHHVVRLVPRNGLVLTADQQALLDVMQMGCWSEQQTLHGVSGNNAATNQGWSAANVSEGRDCFDVLLDGEKVGQVQWTLSGEHNVQNALGAIAAARHVGVVPALACEALGLFRGVKRRMELLGEFNGIRVYDDFAHHPTAIASTLQGLRAQVGGQNIVAVLEPRSNTMKQGVHQSALLQSIQSANQALWFAPNHLDWDLDAAVSYSAKAASNTELQSSRTVSTTQQIIDMLLESSQPGDHIVIMSNGGFEGIHQRLVTAMKAKYDLG